MLNTIQAPTTIIRPAVPADADELEKIYYFANLDAALKTDLSLAKMKQLVRMLEAGALGDFKDLSPSFIDRSDRALFVAVSPDNTPYGMAAVMKLDDERAELQRVAVDPLKQGGGTAKKLMLHCIDYVLYRWNSRYLELWTRDHMQAAVNFYRKIGFTETERSKEGTYLELNPMHFRAKLNPGLPLG